MLILHILTILKIPSAALVGGSLALLFKPA